MYSAADAQRLVNTIGPRIFETIQAKKDIQQLMLKSITNDERNALAKDILLDSLITRVIQSAKLYGFSFGSTDSDKACIALATGTILKELDNWNVKYIAPDYLAKIMNQL